MGETLSKTFVFVTYDRAFSNQWTDWPSQWAFLALSVMATALKYTREGGLVAAQSNLLDAVLLAQKTREAAVRFLKPQRKDTN